jgi:putative endonuclease
MPAPTHNQRIGRWGEDHAVEYLLAHGYEILARNVRLAHGELDIIARQDHQIVFVEVKTRTSDMFGPPETAIDLRKQERLVSAIEKYLEQHPELGERWQVDAISIEGKPGATPRITHFENVI